MPEVITSGRNGILVPPRSSEALAKEINGLLEDRRARKRIGANARHTVVSKFDWNRNARKMADLYEEVVENT
jgi:glycosyltransferase involved in cell wall biosynthesis